MDATTDAITENDASADSPASDGAASEGAAGDSAKQDAPGEAAAAACAMFDASGLDEGSVAAGFQQVWQVYRCWGCHQGASQAVTDAGSGIVLSGNNAGLGDSGTIFPPNLTNDPTGIGCLTNQQVQDAILSGADPEGGTLCPSMPKWGHAMTIADGGPRFGTPMDAGTAQEIVAFLRSLPPVMNTVMDTTCPAMDSGSDAATDASGDAPSGDAASEAGDAGSE
jgi:hypothetical protein